MMIAGTKMHRRGFFVRLLALPAAISLAQQGGVEAAARKSFSNQYLGFTRGGVCGLKMIAEGRYGYACVPRNVCGEIIWDHSKCFPYKTLRPPSA
jgi:hypothetical protein